MISLNTFLRAVDFAREGSLKPDSDLHGELHWRGVASQGLAVARFAGLGEEARAMAALFGLFHDCRRHNDDWDPEHGERGSQAMMSCNSLSVFGTSFRDRLSASLIMHDKGEVIREPLIGLGWDADRSLLTRCGMIPDFTFFSCTPEEHFDELIEIGHSVNEAPPTWTEIWRDAFQG